jgi:hypothetical protein
MIKRKREILQLAEGEGLKDIEVVCTNGNHYRIEASYKGKPVKIITPFSPSCYRSSLNLRGNIRRAMRAIATPKVAMK